MFGETGWGKRRHVSVPSEGSRSPFLFFNIKAVNEVL